YSAIHHFCDPWAGDDSAISPAEPGPLKFASLAAHSGAVMSTPGPTAYAFNCTREAYLATQLRIAGTHWSRFRGLMCADRSEEHAGRWLCLVLSPGLHTFAMRF